MTDLIKQIEAKVDEMADDYSDTMSKWEHQPSAMRGFLKGAQSMMPLIEKLIEQKNFYILECRDGFDADLAKKSDIKELLELLKKDDK